MLEVEFEPKKDVTAVDRLINDRRAATRRRDDFYWLRRLSKITGDAAVVIDRMMSIDHIDERVFEILEIRPDLIDKFDNFSDLCRMMAEYGYFGPGQPEVFEALITDLLTNQRIKQREETQTLQCVTPSGRHVTMEMSFSSDDRHVLLFRDVTTAYLEEQALNTALQVGGSGYWYYNLETKEHWMKGQALSHRFSPERFNLLERDSAMTIIHPDDRKKATDALRAAIVERRPQSLIVRVAADGGDTVWLKGHVKPNVDETGTTKSIICFFTDVSAQLRIQDDLTSAQEKAQKALKSKTAFLGRLSHEVRTPMNAVIGLADALIHHHGDETINPKLEMIQVSAEKIVRLVDETLKHSKLEEDEVELNLRQASPGAIVQTACALWQDQARRAGTQLTCTIDPSVPELIEVDDMRYEQCLNNLLSNAVKFTEGGSVKVALTVAGEGVANRQLVLAVRDTGIGMDPDQLARVFVPYKQADKSIAKRYGGTGLGMSITKNLIELMGGKIAAKSAPGEGTLFVLTLPIKVQTTVSQDSQALVDNLLDNEAPAAKPDLSQLRVLVVDDNSTNHMVVRSLLHEIVGHVDEAFNGEDAIENLEANSYDVVLMDIHMPVMDGIEATLAIRSSDAPYMDVPIIALTADPQYQQIRLCRNIGMDDALAKPIRLTNLLRAFETVMGDRALLAEKKAA